MTDPFSKDDTNGIETIAVHAGEYIDTAYRASSPKSGDVSYICTNRYHGFFCAGD